jgi:hypothetical protein
MFVVFNILNFWNKFIGYVYGLSINEISLAYIKRFIIYDQKMESYLDISWVGVSNMSDYRLGDRGSIPDRGKNFLSSVSIQTSSEAHPASCPMGTVGSFLGVKRSRVVRLTIHTI